MSFGNRLSSLTARLSHLIEIELTPDLVVVDPFRLWVAEPGESRLQVLALFEIDLERFHDEGALGAAGGSGEGVQALCEWIGQADRLSDHMHHCNTSSTKRERPAVIKKALTVSTVEKQEFSVESKGNLHVLFKQPVKRDGKDWFFLDPPWAGKPPTG